MLSVHPLRVLIGLAFAAGVTTGVHAQMFSYTGGHGDIGIGYESGAFDLHVHLHAGAVVGGSTLVTDTEFTPEQILTVVPGPSVPRPGSDAYAFLGTPAGQPVWLLPQAQVAGKPFFGVGAEELSASDWVGSLSLTLTHVQGPAGGNVSLWQSDTFGSPVVSYSTADGITGADVYHPLPGSHEHFNFGFTEPGNYELTLHVEGTHVVDGFQQSDATYAFAVAPVPEPGHYAVLVGLGLVSFAVFRKRRANA